MFQNNRSLALLLTDKDSVFKTATSNKKTKVSLTEVKLTRSRISLPLKMNRILLSLAFGLLLFVVVKSEDDGSGIEDEEFGSTTEDESLNSDNDNDIEDEMYRYELNNFTE